MSSPPPTPTPAPESPLCFAAAAGDLEEMEGLMASYGADTSDGASRTPLLFATVTGNVAAARMLLEAGAAVDRPYEGLSPLCHAVHARQDAIASLLLEFGATVPCDCPIASLLATWASGTPSFPLLLSAGLRVAPASLCSREASRECATALLLAGADIDAPMPGSAHTPLSLAASYGDHDLLTFLLEMGAAVDAAAERGLTPLCAAAQGGSAECVATLAAAGASLNLRPGGGGGAALHYAVRGGSDRAVARLAACGADVNSAGGDGRAPIVLAASQGHIHCLRALLHAGARTEGGVGGAALRCCAASECGNLLCIEVLLAGAVISDAELAEAGAAARHPRVREVIQREEATRIGGGGGGGVSLTAAAAAAALSDIASSAWRLVAYPLGELL